MSTIFKTKYLRNTLILISIIALASPAIFVFYIRPLYKAQLVRYTEAEAIRVTRHLKRELVSSQNKWTKGSLPTGWTNKIKQAADDFKLMKLKLFSRSGEIIYSTDIKDIGVINKNRYFVESVAKGNVYTKVVGRDTKSLEGQFVAKSVVETYVPIMENDTFSGAIEIYYDITDREKNLNKLLSISIGVLLVLSATIMAVTILILNKTAKSLSERERIEQALKENEKKYRTLLETSPDPIIVLDAQRKVVYLNAAFERVFGWSPQERVGKKMDNFVPKEEWPQTRLRIEKLLAGESFSAIRTERLTKEGKKIEVSISVSPYRDDEGNISGYIISLRDVTKYKQMEKEQEKLIKDLQDAMSKIKTLKGMLPICSHCKKIRNDEGYWNKIESYISAHSDARFSHGICPECLQKYFPEYADDE